MPLKAAGTITFLLACILTCCTGRTAQAQPCGTPGKDGAGTISGIVNTYYPGTATAAIGDQQISVGTAATGGATTPIAAGDLLLVMQMQDAAIHATNDLNYGANTGTGSGYTARNNAGAFEYVVATGPIAAGKVPIVGGGTGTGVSGGLINTYTNAAATSTMGQRRFQVIRVPQYGSPKLSSSLTALGWNGAVGGVLVIDAYGAVNLNGATVSVDSLGFRGGGGQTLSGGSGSNDSDTLVLSTVNYDASKGEGIAGTPRFVYNGSTETDNGSGNEGYPNGSFARGAPANAGGGGTEGTTGTNQTNTNQYNCGGGGGGNGGAGGIGGNCWSTGLADGGFGGVAFPASRSTPLITMGGGGGAGDSNNNGPGHGGPGGGIIIIRTNSITGTGTLSANGAKPCTATATCTNLSGSGQVGSTQDGAGGGGAGGTILVDVNTTVPPGGNSTTGVTANAKGGDGGDVNWPDTDPHGPGGGGGGGVVYFAATGGTSAATHGGHGAAGTPTSDDIAYGSADGTDGVVSTGTITIPGARPNFRCITSQALIASFRATPLDGGALLEWETSSQAGTAGFYVSRYDPPTGTWLRLNDRLLPAAIEAPQGGLYRFRDPDASPFERHAYSLVEVESNGRQRLYGPYTVTTEWGVTPAPIAPMLGQFASSPRRPTTNADDSTARAGTETAAAGAAPTTRAALDAPSSSEAGRGEAMAPAAAASSDNADAASRSALAGSAIGRLAAAAAGGTQLKLYVTADGLYAVTAAALAQAAGAPLATVTQLIARHQVVLTSHGQAVTWQAAADSSALRFYGESPTGIYSPENVYWLSFGVSAPMTTAASGSPAATNTPVSFPAKVHFEQNLFAGVSVALDANADYWFWKATLSGDPTYGTQGFPLTVNGVAGSGNASLGVHLQGASASGVAGEHHVQVSLNGSTLGSTSWEGVTPWDATFTFNAGLLHEGANDLEITGVLDSGVPLSVSYTNSFDLAYRRLTATDGSPLVVTPDMPGPLTVSGFLSPNLAVYDISQPKAPVALSGLTVDAAAGVYRASFTPAALGHPYLAVDTSTLATPRIEVWQPPLQALRSPANRADHLIITPAAFATAAAVLASHRQAQGLVSQVVTVEQIYDEFNDGLASPQAIEAFLAYAASSWQKHPQYVVLAGNGNFDYKNYLGLGGNPVPPLMITTADGLFAADSSFLAFPGGRGMAIGRLPATSSLQLAGIIAKLTAYETTGSAGWKKQIVMAADAPDEGGQFDDESDLASALVAPPFSATKLYIDQLTATTAHQQLLSQLASGIYLLNYVGHGGLDRMSSQGLLTNDDAVALSNSPRLALVAAASCIIGRFEVPGFEPLAVTLLDNPHGGAAAVWAPSGLTFDAQTSTLDRALLPILLGAKTQTLGTAIQAADQGFTAAGGTADTTATYILFGDPAMPLQKQK